MSVAKEKIDALGRIIETFTDGDRSDDIPDTIKAILSIFGLEWVYEQACGEDKEKE
jgi:hypothetical protein